MRLGPQQEAPGDPPLRLPAWPAGARASLPNAGARSWRALPCAVGRRPQPAPAEQARVCGRGRSPELECSAGVCRNPREAFQPAPSAAAPTADAGRGARGALQACPRRAGEKPGRQRNRQNQLPPQAELLWRPRGHSVGRQGGRAWSLGREEPLEKGMATRSISLPAEAHGQRSLAGFSPRVTQSRAQLSDRRFHFHTAGAMKTATQAPRRSEQRRYHQKISVL